MKLFNVYLRISFFWQKFVFVGIFWSLDRFFEKKIFLNFCISEILKTFSKQQYSFVCVGRY